MHIETAVLHHLCSVLYHTHVSRVIMLTKQRRDFCLKMWYKSDFPVTVAQWRNHFDSLPPTCKATYNLHQQFQEHVTMFDPLRMGSLRIVSLEENKAFFVKQ
jgi:hypothetical protein